MPVDEEVVLLEEQLASAHADVEQLQARLGEAEALAASREAEGGELRRQPGAARGGVAQKAEALAAKEAELAELRTGAAAAEERLRAAANRYREAVLAQEPQLPSELVNGETIEEIDESLARARPTVAPGRARLEPAKTQMRRPPRPRRPRFPRPPRGWKDPPRPAASRLAPVHESAAAASEASVATDGSRV